MNYFLTLMASALAILGTAQCQPSTLLNVADLCSGWPETIEAITDAGTCDDAVSYNWQWNFFGNDGATYLGQSGTVTLAEDIPDGTVPTDIFSPSVNACLFVEAFDADGNSIGSSNSCVTLTPSLEDELGTDWLNTTCSGSCIYFSPENGWWWNYSIEVDGVEIETWEPYCFETLGLHTVTVYNANGCSLSQEVDATSLPSDSNDLCTIAMPLTSGQLHYDETCSGLAPLEGCTGWTYGVDNWFSFNSDTYDYLELSMVLDSIFVYSLSVYEAGPLGCIGGDLEEIYCYGSEITDCLQVGEDYLLAPSTDYFVRVQTPQGASFELGMLLSMSSDPQSLCGCADPENCLYNPEALVSTSCGNEGCTDESACNYMWWAQCEDGSCEFGDDLNVQLFYDVNGDGVMQGGFFGEDPLGNTGAVTIEELDLTVFPDGSGSFVLPELELGTYTITFNDPTGLWYYSGPTTVTLPTCDGFNMGLSPSSDQLFQVSGPCCIWMMDLHCEFGMNPGLWVENTGSVPLNGTFVMTFDDLLIPEPLSGATVYDSYSPGVLVWNIVDQAPGESVLYQCHIQGPGTDYIGQVFPFDMQLELLDPSGVVAFSDSWLLEPEVVCAYDPNDKYAVPEGYTDEHFILPDGSIEYRIRFQNTGNFPAATVRIEDQLDLAHLDIDTFEPVFASHDFSTELSDDGLVKFIFNDIQLPALEDDEPGSQGYVVYRIAPLSDIEPGDVIENTAEIYFDGNPPIITNTTWHTIFDCAWIWGEDGLGDEILHCGDDLEITLSQPYVEHYQWYIDGELIEDFDADADFSDWPLDSYEVEVTAINPLCEVTETVDVLLVEIPEEGIVQDGNLLAASPGETYQWYLNGEPIEGATGQTYTGTEDGVYSVTVTNADACDVTSEIDFVLGVTEWANGVLQVYPNPASDHLYIKGMTERSRVRVINAQGQVALEVQLDPGTPLDVSPLAVGSYTLQLYLANGVVNSMFTVR